jgi:hypothetical protein
MFLFTREKDECGAEIKVFQDNVKVLDTFVRFENNQKVNYWFSCLTYKDFNVKELRLSDRTEYIIDYEFCTSANKIKNKLAEINHFIHLNLHYLVRFVKSDISCAYFDKI